MLGTVPKYATALANIAQTAPASIISPTPGQVPSGQSTFTWNSGNGATQYQLTVGSSVGGTNYYSASLGSAQSASVNIPSSASAAYVTLSSLTPVGWLAQSYVYGVPAALGSVMQLCATSLQPICAISLQPSAPPVTISSPVPGDTITGCSVPAGVTAAIAGSAGSQTVAFTASAMAQIGTTNIACSTAAANTLLGNMEIEGDSDGIDYILAPQTGPGRYHLSIYGYGFGDNAGSLYIGGAASNYYVTSWTDGDIEADLTVPDGVCGSYPIEIQPAGDPDDPEDFAPGPVYSPLGLCPDVVSPPTPTAQIMMGTASPPPVVSGNAADSPTVVSVGQQIVLTGSVNDLGGLTVVSQIWTVGGTTVKSYSPLDMTTLNLAATPPVCSAPMPAQLQAPDLTQPQITFYWIDGDPGTNSVTNDVTYTATLSDGSKAKAIAGFRPVKPSAITSTVEFSGATTTNVPAVSIAVAQNGVVTLGFGSSGAPQSDGITFNMNLSTTIGGKFALLQLVNFADTNTFPSGAPSVSSSKNLYVLDNGASSNGFPQYNGMGGIIPADPNAQPSWSLVDDPNVAFTGASGVSVTQQFKTYLMYQPPNANSLWVTLQLMSWNWNGQSALANGVWPTPTAFPPGVPTFSPNPSGSDSATLPTWGSCAKGNQ